MASSIINSDDGSVSGTTGLKTTGGDDGELAFESSGTEAMRIDSSGRVGIGTSSPTKPLHIYGNTSNNHQLLLDNAYGSGSSWNLNAYGANGTLYIGNSADRLAIDSSGNLKFDSGWVNFNGNGTVAIRASGNVSSITDHAAGDYTVNFTTAMPDANYAPQITFGQNGNSNPSYTPIVFELGQSTTSSRLQTNGATGGKADVSIVCVAVFR
jgi:hypothetical protein